jgi:N6-adenosine-specific RNA methylase IME4
MESRQERQSDQDAIRQMLTGIPNGMRAGAIMADPALAFTCRSAKGERRSPQAHYRCTPFAELAGFPVADIADTDCFLFLWIPLRSVYLVEPLMRAWGFAFSGAGFV